MIITARFRNALAAILVVLMASTAAWCFPPPEKKDPKELLTDFIFYAKVANVELAVSNGQALIDSGVTNADLATMLDEGKETTKRFDEAVARAQMVPEMEVVASELARRVDAGKLDLARDPKRIQEAVTMLTGVQRARQLAERRLVAAGEYAVPALLAQITEGHDEQLKLSCQSVLVKIGQQAVPPLCEALLNLTGVSQRIVCDILGTIKHPNAAPYLRELAMNEKADGPAREAAKRAFNNLGVSETGLSALYTTLARQYFDSNESLVANPNEATNNVWSYDNFGGLVPKPVPTAIFSQIMAVRTSSKAVRIDPNNSTALSLFVAANLKRENDLPAGAADPIYGENKYTPEFYATVFGTQTCLDVLALAIDKLDTPLVRDAINALAKSTGGANLFARGKGRQPLLEAMSYPDRRVQYEAALTLGRALPQQKFGGDQSVVPILASAIRSGSKPLATVIATNQENLANYRSQVEQLGFQIMATGADVAEVQSDLAKASGTDLIVIQMNSAEDDKKAVTVLRAIPKTSAAPILVIASALDKIGLDREYRGDRRVKVMRPGLNPQEWTANVESLMQSASGGRMTEAEAEEYAIKALGALRDVAISRSPAYSITDAESALIDAVVTRTGGTRMLVADILALIDDDAAQRKLFDVALTGTGEEQVALLYHVADSVRLFGDRAEKRHVTAVVDLVANSTGPTAEAAATVLGALNLPNSDAVKLLPQQ